MAGTHRTCEICGIKEKKRSDKCFFARFPLDKQRCVEWLKVVGKEDLAYLPIEKLYDLRHVCGIHFQKRDFTKSGTRLKKRAVPKLHLASVAPLTDDTIADFLRLNPNVDAPTVSRPSEGLSTDAVNYTPAIATSVALGTIPSIANIGKENREMVKKALVPIDAVSLVQPFMKQPLTTSVEIDVNAPSPTNTVSLVHPPKKQPLATSVGINVNDPAILTTSRQSLSDSETESKRKNAAYISFNEQVAKKPLRHITFVAFAPVANCTKIMVSMFS